MWAVAMALCIPSEGALAEAAHLSGPDVTGVVQTTARLGQFCNKVHLQFLPDADVAISEAARAWAESRRLVVRYSAEAATVTIIPPRTGEAPEVRDLLSEITSLIINIDECPDGVGGIPTNISVERLDIVEEGDELDFRVAPY